MSGDARKPRGRPPGDRHRWAFNLWVTDAEEATIRSFFVRRHESMSEAARRLLLQEVEAGETPVASDPEVS